jgi:hypothetical protein
LDVLEKVIFSLTSDEVRRFKILSNRFKSEDEKKLIVLFDTIRSEKFIDEEQEIVKTLYQTNDAQTRNRYYRLRNKLLENIEKSLTFYHFKYKDSIHAYYDIQLAIMFRERGGYALAFYFLKKAEKKAKELDQFNILEVIYEEYTQLAVKDIEIDIEEILERRKANLEKVKIQRRNTEAIAIITQQLKKSNFSREKSSVIDLLEKTLKNVEASAEIFHSSEGKIQVFRVVGALLVQKEAYGQLVEYVNTTIQTFESANLFNSHNHADRLMMRHWLVNALMKTRRFVEAEANLEIFEKELSMHHKQNYFAYLLYFINSSINVSKYLGKSDKSGQLIHEALNTKELRMKSDFEFFLMRSLADQHFLIGEYSKALQTMQEAKKLDGYKAQEDEIKMYCTIFELLLRMECGQYSFIPEEYSEFKKTYRRFLKTEEHQSVSLFLEILVKINSALEKGKLPNLKKMIHELDAICKDEELGGNSIINYAIYANAKAKGIDYYQLQLDTISKK